MGFDRCPVAHQVLAGDDDLFGARQSFGDFNSALDSIADLYRDLKRLAVFDDIHILQCVESGERVYGNLNGVLMYSYHHLDSGKHASFKAMIVIRKIYFDRHRTRLPVQRLDDARDGSLKHAIRIGLRANLGLLTDCHQRDIFLHDFDQRGPCQSHADSGCRATSSRCCRSIR